MHMASEKEKMSRALVNYVWFIGRILILFLYDVFGSNLSIDPPQISSDLLVELCPSED